jgi:glutamate transport system permease protein
MSVSVLYDVPGPIARRRARIASLMGLVVIAGGASWLIYTLAAPRTIAGGAVLPGMFDPSRLDILGRVDLWVGLWNALLSTLALAAVGALLAMAVGIAFMFARLASSRWVRTPTAILLEFFRGMPVLLMMLFILLVFSTGSFWAGAAALAVYNGAVIGEALRAGVQALPRGQREAGLAIGLTSIQTRLIIEFPQAFRHMLPVIIAQLVVLLKDTSLAFVVGYSELLRYAENMQHFFGGRYLFTLFGIVLLLYLGVNLILSWVAREVARRTGSTALRA